MLKGVVYQTRGKYPKIYLIRDSKFFTLSPVNFFDSNQITFKTNLDDTFDGNEQCWSKRNFKKGAVLSDQREIPLKLTFSDSESNQITFKTNLDDTFDGDEQ